MQNDNVGNPLAKSDAEQSYHQEQQFGQENQPQPAQLLTSQGIQRPKQQEALIQSQIIPINQNEMLKSAYENYSKGQEKHESPFESERKTDPRWTYFLIFLLVVYAGIGIWALIQGTPAEVSQPAILNIHGNSKNANNYLNTNPLKYYFDLSSARKHHLKENHFLILAMFFFSMLVSSFMLTSIGDYSFLLLQISVFGKLAFLFIVTLIIKDESRNIEEYSPMFDHLIQKLSAQQKEIFLENKSAAETGLFLAFLVTLFLSIVNLVQVAKKSKLVEKLFWGVQIANESISHSPQILLNGSELQIYIFSLTNLTFPLIIVQTVLFIFLSTVILRISDIYIQALFLWWYMVQSSSGTKSPKLFAEVFKTYIGTITKSAFYFILLYPLQLIIYPFTVLEEYKDYQSENKFIQFLVKFLNKLITWDEQIQVRITSLSYSHVQVLTRSIDLSDAISEFENETQQNLLNQNSEYEGNDYKKQKTICEQSYFIKDSQCYSISFLVVFLICFLCKNESMIYLDISQYVLPIIIAGVVSYQITYIFVGIYGEMMLGLKNRAPQFSQIEGGESIGNFNKTLVKSYFYMLNWIINPKSKLKQQVKNQ